MRCRKNADDGPGIRSDGVPLLGCTQEEMKISLQKRIEVLLAHFGKRMRFVAIGHPQAIPVKRSNLPVEDLQSTLPPRCIGESVGKIVWKFGD